MKVFMGSSGKLVIRVVVKVVLKSSCERCAQSSSERIAQSNVESSALSSGESSALFRFLEVGIIVVEQTGKVEDWLEMKDKGSVLG